MAYLNYTVLLVKEDFSYLCLGNCFLKEKYINVYSVLVSKKVVKQFYHDVYKKSQKCKNRNQIIYIQFFDDVLFCSYNLIGGLVLSCFVFIYNKLLHIVDEIVFGLFNENKNNHLVSIRYFFVYFIKEDSLNERSPPLL
ncbi:hypothetical protein [Chryseobacterium candidae]|uniref:Uncharacterized protein n=1 Tax=Chryseobacterium candidae TaxID=1978493 RepID=A0ABY2R6L5_9FLAO|nr:hypothetical protein [Chryseobacterium candidae]THV59386.1 hypothetical protein EK417_11185 [Chryseobacterium candidae]